jgi:hypothetical protein
MIGRSPRSTTHRGGCAAIVTLLLMLVSLAVPLEASQPVHLHEAGTAGLYNEEHVLGSLDSLVGDLPLPDARFAVFIALVAEACLTAAGARLCAPVLDLAASRAPPLA